MQRRNVGSSDAASAVDGLSITNTAIGPALQVRLSA
jgi:hypothetical protein